MKRNDFSYFEGSIGYIFTLIAVFLLNMLVIEIASIAGINSSNLSSNNWIIYLSLILIELFYLIIILIISKKNKINFKNALKLNSKINSKIILLSILLAITVLFSSLNVTNFFNSLFPASDNSMTINSFLDFLIWTVVYALIPCVCEELFFRGFIYNSLKSKLNAILSIFLSSLIFTLLHLSILQTFYQFIIGIFLATLVYLTGSIVYSIVFHFINNFTILLVSYLSKDYPLFQFTHINWLTILLSILIFIVGMIASFFIVKFIKKQSNNLKDKQIKNEEMNILVENQNEVFLGNIFFIFTTVIFFVLWAYNSFGGA